MYPPLQFIEQVSSYVHVIGISHDEEKEINKRLLGYLEELFCSDENKGLLEDFVKDYVTQSERVERIGKYPKRIVEKYKTIEKGISTALGNYIPWLENPYDTLNYLMQSLLVNSWKYNKIAYRVSLNLGRQLIEMKEDAVVNLYSLRRLPAKTIYIDTSDFGNFICDDMLGFFVISSEVNDKDGHYLYVCFITLVKGITGRVLPIFSKFRTDMTDCTDEDKLLVESNNYQTIVHSMEDGCTRRINESLLLKLFVNVMTYLQASNRDVKECSGCRKAFSKKNEEEKGSVSNKFKDVKQYEVGYHIVRFGKRNNSSLRENSKGVGGKKSPHFRSAHWSHYWVGSGEEKHLELRWIEGIYVGEKNSDSDVAIHVVE